MNTFFKKITAAAMAVALLGTGATVTNSISKTTGKSFGIEADAAGWVIRNSEGLWGLIGIGRTISYKKNGKTTTVTYNTDVALYQKGSDIILSFSGICNPPIRNVSNPKAWG